MPAESTPSTGPSDMVGTRSQSSNLQGMLQPTLGLRDTFPEHGTFLYMRLPTACPTPQQGKQTVEKGYWAASQTH